MNALTVLLTVGALAALSSVMVVMMLAQPRIFLAMSKDGLLPRMGRPHPSALQDAAHLHDRHRQSPSRLPPA